MTGNNISNDPVILATASYDHNIKFWQAHTGICQKTLQHTDSQVNDLEITPDRQLIAAAGYQHIRLYDINGHNTSPVINYDSIPKNVTVVGFQADGKWMFTGGEEGTVRIWDLRSKNVQCQKMFTANSPVNTVFLHPNQGELYIGDQSGTIYVWDIKSNKDQQVVPERNASIQCISINNYGAYLAAVNNKGSCYLWSLTRGRTEDPVQLLTRNNFVAHKKYALKCQFSPDSTLLATTSADATVKLWKTADFSLMTELKEKNQRWVWDCAFSGDSQYIVTASSDNMARLWSVDTGEIKREYNGHQKAVICLAFRDDLTS